MTVWRSSILGLLVLLFASGCAIGGSGVDQDEYVAQNRSILDELPRFPGSTGRDESSGGYRLETGGTVVSYVTSIESTLPSDATADEVLAHFRAHLDPDWKVFERVELRNGPVVRFRRGAALASIYLEPASHKVEIAANSNFFPSATATHPSQTRNGEWIAYSTAPYGDQTSARPRPAYAPAYVAHAGSDIFIAREGGKPILVASRGAAGRTWNACPTFSPDGTKLAFGTASPGRTSVRVVRVTRAGVSAPRRVKLNVGVTPLTPRAPCPRWSADGSRLDYATPNADSDPLVSPPGDLIARLSNVSVGSCSVLVERPDGSGGRVVPVARHRPGRCPYSVAAWSPDGRRLLLMYDVTGRDFTMFAIDVSAPFKRVGVVERVRVNHGSSWPGRGDVSWQPRRPS